MVEMVCGNGIYLASFMKIVDPSLIQIFIFKIIVLSLFVLFSLHVCIIKNGYEF
jgi:hypothetical protein